MGRDVFDGMTRLKQLHILKAIFKCVLFLHNKTPKVFCLTFGVHVRNIRAFFVPATGVITNFFLEDLERIWALRDVIPNPPDSKILDNHFEK